MEQQFIELGAAFFVQTHNLSVQNSATAIQFRPNCLAQHIERSEGIPVAGKQAANSVRNECKRTEAVVFQLEKPIRV